jgi:23S rRNA (cytidine2498-2'-O)-methyltransferase
LSALLQWCLLLLMLVAVTPTNSILSREQVRDPQLTTTTCSTMHQRAAASLPPRAAFVVTLLPHDALSKTMRAAPCCPSTSRFRTGAERVGIAAQRQLSPSICARTFTAAATLISRRQLNEPRPLAIRIFSRGIHASSVHFAAPSEKNSFSSAVVPSPTEWPAFPALQPNHFLLGYLAHSGRLEEMLDELDAQENAATLGLQTSVLQLHGNLVIVRVDSFSDQASPPPNMLHPLHCATIWFQPQLLSFTSISAASRALRKAGAEQAGRGQKWTCYDAVDGLRRRAALVAEELPCVDKRLDEMMLFPLSLHPVSKAKATPASSSSSSVSTLTDAPLRSPGCFTLLTPNQLLFSPTTSSPFPNGSIEFVYDRQAPPSRAYLKLYEALTRMQVKLMQRHGIQKGQQIWNARKPQPGQVVLDLGSAPGGWTWAAAASCGASVLSIDRAPLDPRVSSLPNVRHVIRSGFSIEPDEEGIRSMLQEREKRLAVGAVDGVRSVDDSSPRRVDWLLCDIISYPDRALSLIQRWLQADAVEHGMIVTIKLQRAGEATTEDSSDAESSPRSSKGPAQRYHLSHQPTILRALRAIPNGEVVHLCANKNEATFLWMKEREEQKGATKE